jgi:hypothetical protein
MDPADGAPDHIDIQQYVLDRGEQGCVFHKEFLAVERRAQAERSLFGWLRANLA